MSPTLALIPAKSHSTGVPGKNWTPIIGGRHCTDLALAIGAQTCDRLILSTNRDLEMARDYFGEDTPLSLIQRPSDLPDAMLDVVKHALQQVPGPDDEIIVLLQPSSPLRTVETVQRAIQMLRDAPMADSVVSVSPSYPIEWSLRVLGGELADHNGAMIGAWPSRRQDCEPTYRRDGVVYAFRRATLREGDISGCLARPLFTPPSESLSIDTPEDWDEAVRRLQADKVSA